MRDLPHPRRAAGSSHRAPRGALTGLGLVALMLAALPGCGGPGGGGRSRGALAPEELHRKILAYQQVHFHQRQFFVAVGTGPDLQSATAAAYAKLTAQLTWLPEGSRDMLVGLYRVDKSSTDNQGNTHLLAVLEREKAATYLRQKAIGLEERAKDKMVTCREAFEAKEIPVARQCLMGVERLLGRVKSLLAASRAAVGDDPAPAVIGVEEDARSLRQLLDTGVLQQRTVLLHISAAIDGSVVDRLDAQFAPVLSEQGYKQIAVPLPDRAVARALSGAPGAILGVARQHQAGLVIIGKVEARFSSELDGQFFSFAGGRVQMIDTQRGRVVGEASCRDIKGGHISRERAGQKAIKLAVARLAPALAEQAARLAAETRSSN